MFINSKKCFEVRDGDRKLVIPRDFIGSIPSWAAKHWLVQAAIRDGSIATPENMGDKALESADGEAEQKAKDYDIRPDGEKDSPKEPDKQAGAARKKA